MMILHLIEFPIIGFVMIFAFSHVIVQLRDGKAFPELYKEARKAKIPPKHIIFFPYPGVEHPGL